MSTRNPILHIATALTLLFLASAPVAFGQLSTAEQKCVNSLNLDGSLVAKMQGNENYLCLKKAGLGVLPGPAQTCLTADSKQKVQKKKDKTAADEVKFCAAPPSFGHTGPTTVNGAAVQEELNAVADVFGANLDSALISCATSKPGCLCQQKVLKDVEKLAAAKRLEFVLCKKAALKAGATSAAALVDCVNNPGTVGSIAADTKGKIQKKADILNNDLISKCGNPGVLAGAFPGVCTGLPPSATGVCIDARVECRVCLTINAMDGLSVDCDLFDDAAANLSCVAAPIPTPTETVAPTPTPTFPPVTFNGALLKSTGLFTYAAMVGVPGANTECNTNFAGSHACSFNELLAAEATGQLVGVTDVGSNTVTALWAIDSTHSNLVQCGTVVPWDYQTAHTGHQGQFATLNNGTGDLGPLVTGLNCLNQRWVGCCQ